MKTVLITGAARGLGNGILIKHLEDGDNCLAIVRNETDGMAALKKQYGEQLDIFICDVADNVAVETLSKQLEERVKHIDIVYNVAGVNHLEVGRNPLRKTDLSDDEMLYIYNVNAVGPMRICKAVWNLIDKDSVVMNVSSESGSIGECQRKGEYAYCMSKAALNMGTKLLGNELNAIGARVFCTHPGWVRTDMGGPEAAASEYSVSIEESAEHLVAIARKGHSYPMDVMFLDHTGRVWSW